MSLTDICVNLTNGQFNTDRGEVLERARAAGVERLVLTGTDIASSRALLALTDGSSSASTAGIHPHDIGSADANWLDILDTLLKEPDVRAVGETGLDFNRNYSTPDEQRSGFAEQIALAQRHDMPLFVHDRDSDGEVLALLRNAGDLPPTVIHCFTGTKTDLVGYLDAGFYIGITGWIADRRRGDRLRELVPLIPLDRLMIETDAPFLRPQNAPRKAIQGQSSRRNEPALLPYVLDAIATQRREPPEEIAAATHETSARFFGFTRAPE